MREYLPPFIDPVPFPSTGNNWAWARPKGKNSFFVFDMGGRNTRS